MEHDDEMLIDTPWGKKRWRTIRRAFEERDELLAALVVCSGDISEDEAEANGRLYAAAPELLAACEQALSMYEVQLQLDAEQDETCKLLRAAIAKAGAAK